MDRNAAASRATTGGRRHNLLCKATSNEQRHKRDCCIPRSLDSNTSLSVHLSSELHTTTNLTCDLVILASFFV